MFTLGTVEPDWFIIFDRNGKSFVRFAGYRGDEAGVETALF